MELYGRRVFALVLGRLFDPEVARDLTQETLLTALAAARAGKLLAPDKLPGYLRGTARNLCNNHLRGLSAKPLQIRAEPPSSVPDPEVRFRQRELLTHVGRWLGELARTDQKILLWSLVDELSSEEIGKRLDMRAETVRQHKSRALEKIRSRARKMSQNPSPRHCGSGGSK